MDKEQQESMKKQLDTEIERIRMLLEQIPKDSYCYEVICEALAKLYFVKQNLDW